MEQPIAPPAPPGDQARRPALDGALLTRLWWRAEQPGCVRHGQARALLARHRRMAGEPPLAELLLRRGRGTDIQPSGPLVVAARPATAAPGADPPNPPVPGARAPQASPPGAAAPRATAPSAVPQPTVRARPARPYDQPPSLPSPPRREAPAPADPARLAAPLQPAGSNPAPTTATGTLTPQAQAQPTSAPPVVAASAAPPVVTVPAARPVLSAPARLVSGPAAMPSGTGPAPTASEVRRPVVRAGAGRKPTTLAWPLPAPEQAGGTGGPARPPVPVVRELVSPPGAWRPGPSVPQPPAVLQRAAPPSAGPTASGLARIAAPARAADPARPADPARTARDPYRTPPEEPPGHRADQRERTRPAPPQIDVNRIVSTVQRRLTHQMAIERERRGMRR